MNTKAKVTATTKAYAAKIYHAADQSGTSARYTKWFTTDWAPKVPMVAPKPFVINMKSPWADERISGSVSLSTNNDPDML